MSVAKKILVTLLAVMTVLGSAAFSTPSSENDSWRVVKKAVQEDARPARVRGEAKWFKILIMDRHEKGGELKITLPLSLVEGIVQLASHERFKCNGREYDIEFSEILNQLKKAGPMALIEISDDDGLIKVWIE